MILETKDGETYAVHFLHSPYEEIRRYRSGSDKVIVEEIPRFTICTIHAGKCATDQRPCETPGSVMGRADCSQQDQFNREVGRKVAFERAIASYPRELRKQLWNSFLFAGKDPNQEAATTP